MEKRTFDLNISERYVPGWGVWEVGREVISNAIDADRLGYKIDMPSSDHVVVTTKTRPTLAQIKFIGGGTKDGSTQTIGCFGEGIKLAAMVAARLGGSLRIKFDQYLVSYELRYDEDLASRAILMHVEDAPEFCEGMVVDIELPGIAREISGKFLKSADQAMIEKTDPDRLIIYNKGVFVADKPTKSLFDWNLHSSINRDRNVVDFWDIGNHVVRIIEAKIDMQLAMKFMKSPADVFENECLKKHSYQMGNRSARAFLDAFKEINGADAVMATDDIDANRLARRLGKKVVIIDDHFMKVIKTISPEDRVPSVDEVVSHGDRLNIDYSKNYDLADLERIIVALEIPVEIFVFEGSGKMEQGIAEYKDKKRRIYMNSSLWAPGRRSEKLGTFIHELAHVEAKASDGTFDFENELTRISGILARLFLDGVPVK